MKVIQTQKEKIKKRAGQKAIQLAKESGDPFYKIYKKHRRKYLLAKLKILKKYLPRAYSEIRKEMRAG